MRTGHKEKNIILIFCTSIIVLFVMVWLVAPYYASRLLMLFKKYLEVHVMYGSTTGKAVLIFPIIVLTVYVSRWMPKLDLRKIIAGIFIVSVMLWYHSFLIIDQVHTQYGITHADGNHVQICDDTYYNEFISYPHTHSYKSVAHTTLLQHNKYITGEAFHKLYPYSNVLPLLGILFTIFLFLAGLRGLHGYYNILSFIFGYYMIFFSYFDGGILSGFLGLFFLQTARYKPTFSWNFILFHHVRFLATLCVMYSIYFCYHLFNHVQVDVTEILWFTVNSIQSRYIVFLALILLIIPKNRKTLWACVVLLLLFVNSDHWHSITRYDAVVEQNETVLLILYTPYNISHGHTLLSTSSHKIVELTSNVRQSKWDLCQDYMFTLEGMSYRSLVVTVYCSVIQSNDVMTVHNDGFIFRTLQNGTCNIYCDEKLYDYFVMNNTIITSPLGYNTLHSRGHGIPSCFVNSSIVVTQNYNS